MLNLKINFITSPQFEKAFEEETMSSKGFNLKKGDPLPPIQSFAIFVPLSWHV